MKKLIIVLVLMMVLALKAGAQSDSVFFKLSPATIISGDYEAGVISLISIEPTSQRFFMIKKMIFDITGDFDTSKIKALGLYCDGNIIQSVSVKDNQLIFDSLTLNGTHMRLEIIGIFRVGAGKIQINLESAEVFTSPYEGISVPYNQENFPLVGGTVNVLGGDPQLILAQAYGSDSIVCVIQNNGTGISNQPIQINFSPAYNGQYLGYCLFAYSDSTRNMLVGEIDTIVLGKAYASLLSDTGQYLVNLTSTEFGATPPVVILERINAVSVKLDPATPITGDYDPGTLILIMLDIQSVQSIMIKKIIFDITGDFDTSKIKDLALYSDGKVVQYGNIDNGQLIFDNLTLIGSKLMPKIRAMFQAGAGKIQASLESIEIASTENNLNLSYSKEAFPIISGEINVPIGMVDTITTSIETNNNRLDKINIFPNPCSNQINIKSTPNSQIDIYSLSGQLLISAKQIMEKQEIDMGNLSSGNYLVTVTKNGNRITKKIIKQ